ncbi:MAG: metalloregulator ArsR/SmtB family transcription factor [Pseudomonadota bacterium]
MDAIFEALASTPRRKILAYLSEAELAAGQIAAKFEMTKPAVSKHLQILEHAGLVRKRREGQFLYYSLVSENLVNTLNGYLQEVCPVSRPLKCDQAKPRRGGGRADA